MNKVLIVTYYWPPSGGSGVQRWLKFAKYLPQFGWQPVVFTPENPAFEQKDPSLLRDVSPDLEVFKLPIQEPMQLLQRFTKKSKKQFKQGVVKESGSLLQRLMVWIRGNLFIPDPRVFWVKPSVKLLLDLLDSNHINTLVTTGPPHSMHLIGLRLKKKKTDLRWIADFRDPWSEWDMLDHLQVGHRARKKHRRLEKKVMQQADKVVTVSQNLANALSEIGQREVMVINNGFDSTDFPNTAPVIPAKFEISHFGLLNELRDPATVLNAVKVLVNRDPGFEKDVAVKLVGTINSQLIERIKGDELLKEVVAVSPPIPHNDVIRAYYQSSVLLVVVDDSQDGYWQLPGKMFEYMGVGRPILALGPKHSDIGLVLRQTKAGKTFENGQEEEIADYLSELYAKFKTGTAVKIEADYAKFTRRKLTEELSKLLNSL